MSVLRRHGWKVVIAMLAAMTAVIGLAWARYAGAWAIVQADNFDRAPERIAPPSDVDRALRVSVGPPGAELDVWVMEPDRPPIGTVLVLHGIHDHKLSMVGVGRRLRELGMRAILVDLRGHGASSGRFLTYGVVEARDLSQILDRLNVHSPVGVYGPSYGGAAALQLAARDRRVVAVATLSTFASMRRVVGPYARNMAGAAGLLIPEALVQSTLDAGGELARFDPDDADSMRAIATTSARVLLVHGDADTNVPYDHAEALYAACGGPRCQLVRLRGEDHASALRSPVAIDRAAQFLRASLAATPEPR